MVVPASEVDEHTVQWELASAQLWSTTRIYGLARLVGAAALSFQLC
jgi:hypothetical protein